MYSFLRTRKTAYLMISIAILMPTQFCLFTCSLYRWPFIDLILFQLLQHCVQYEESTTFIFYSAEKLNIFITVTCTFYSSFLFFPFYILLVSIFKSCLMNTLLKRWNYFTLFVRYVTGKVFSFFPPSSFLMFPPSPPPF